MQRTTKWVLGSIFMGVAIYAMAPNATNFLTNPGFWTFRTDFVLLSGTISLVLMTLVMLISVRGAWFERFMGGLDKGYVVHKWAGIWAAITGALHWLVEKVPKWTFDWGIWPERAARSAPVDLPPAWQTELWHSGNIAVEYTIYVLIALVIIAVVHRIPYRYFRYTHKIFPAIYLLVAYHSAVIMFKPNWFATPSGYIVVAMCAVGSVAALIGLFQLIGVTKKARAVVSSFERYDNGILDIHLRTVKGDRMVHTPGQFGYLRFEHDTEPHPFTFASSGNDPTCMRFGIKALGFYTTRLSDYVCEGEKVIVEGPYGKFHFDHPSRRQVWVAGGIGITPFMARLENLANTGGTKVPVDFWYCVADAKTAEYPKGLRELCEKAGVTLHVMLADKKEFLSADIINDTVGSMDGVNILFCGPHGFARFLMEGLKKYEFNQRDFHYDNFGMR